MPVLRRLPSTLGLVLIQDSRTRALVFGLYRVHAASSFEYRVECSVASWLDST